MPRAPLQLVARVRTERMAGEALVTNGSLSGVYVEGVLGAQEGESLSLSLVLPDGSWVELEGVVVRADPLGCAIRLVRSAPRFAEFIEFLTDT